MTWTDDKQASEAPATPSDSEGAASPAAKEDPAPEAYAKGDTEEWAEGKDESPVVESEAPAVPSERQAAAMLERKAAKCIRLATAMLGDGASVEAIEDQALAFMDMDDRALHSSLSRLGEDAEKKKEDEEGAEAEAAKTIQEDKEHAAEAKKADDSADEAIDKDDAKAAEEDLAKEATDKEAVENRLAKIEEALSILVGKKAEDDSDDEAMDDDKKASGHLDEDEAMLEAMLAEEGMMEKPEAMEDPEAMLEEMLAEAEAEAMAEEVAEAMSADPGVPGEEALYEDGESHDPGDHDPDGFEESMVVDEAVMMADPVVDDPMGVMARDLDEKDSEMLAVLFGKQADDDDDEDKDEKEDHDEGAIKDDEDHIESLEEDKDEEEKDLKKEEKKAARKPQPKKASKGAKRLGGVSKSAGNEVGNLSQLWESAPDVSRFFN